MYLEIKYIIRNVITNEYYKNSINGVEWIRERNEAEKFFSIEQIKGMFENLDYYPENIIIEIILY